MSCRLSEEETGSSVNTQLLNTPLMILSSDCTIWIQLNEYSGCFLSSLNHVLVWTCSIQPHNLCLIALLHLLLLTNTPPPQMQRVWGRGYLKWKDYLWNRRRKPVCVTVCRLTSDGYLPSFPELLELTGPVLIPSPPEPTLDLPLWAARLFT